MSNRARVAKEQGRKFYEEVVKPAMNERYVVEKYTGKDFELYAILDTKTQLTYRTVFSFEEHAQQVCERLSAKYRKEHSND